MKPLLLKFSVHTFALTIAIFAFAFISKGQCTAPQSMSVYDITGTTMKVNWPAVNNVPGYEYGITTDSTPPNRGIYTTSENIMLQGLRADTRYCVFVRTHCSTGVSAWISQCITTTCSGITVDSLTAYNIHNNTANVMWNPFSSGLAYEYIVNQSTTPPTGKAALTTSSVLLLQGLAADADYCVHVRAFCPVSKTYTDWKTTCFSTPPYPSGISTTTFKDNNISIYPNPATNTLNIVINNRAGKYALTLKDITGRTVYQTNVSDNSTSIDISAITDGIYFINVSGNNLNVTQRIVKAGYK